MLLWLQANLANVILVLSLAVIVFFIVRSMVLDRRAGRCSCGGNCGACPGCAACGAAHGKKEG